MKNKTNYLETLSELHGDGSALSGITKFEKIEELNAFLDKIGIRKMDIMPSIEASKEVISIFFDMFFQSKDGEIDREEFLNAFNMNPKAPETRSNYVWFYMPQSVIASPYGYYLILDADNPKTVFNKPIEPIWDELYFEILHVDFIGELFMPAAEKFYEMANQDFKIYSALVDDYMKPLTIDLNKKQ